MGASRPLITRVRTNPLTIRGMNHQVHIQIKKMLLLNQRTRIGKLEELRMDVLPNNLLKTTDFGVSLSNSGMSLAEHGMCEFHIHTIGF